MRRAMIGMFMFVGFVGMVWVTASVAQDQDDDFSVDSDSTVSDDDKPKRKDRPDRDREPVPQLDYECFPIEVAFNSRDLILTCSEPMIIGDEVIDVFSIRHKIRFSAVAASIITSATANHQALKISVDSTIPSHGRCRDNCRRINNIIMMTDVEID